MKENMLLKLPYYFNLTNKPLNMNGNSITSSYSCINDVYRIIFNRDPLDRTNILYHFSYGKLNPSTGRKIDKYKFDYR